MVMTLYGDLSQQAGQQCAVAEQSVALRGQYVEGKDDIEEAIANCARDMEGLMAPGAAMTEKLDKYQVSWGGLLTLYVQNFSQGT